MLVRWFQALVILVALAALESPAKAQDLPAQFAGDISCEANWAGSFWDIGTGSCWKCPSEAPHRTILPIGGGDACEMRVRTLVRGASGPRDATGWFGTDCPPMHFFDFGLGKCYSCDGWDRTAARVDAGDACSMKTPLIRRAAMRLSAPECPSGSFPHWLSNRCYSCPDGSYRNANTGVDPTTFGACTACGRRDQAPCPVTTLRKSCDDGLVEDFVRHACVETTESRIERLARDKAAELLPEFASVFETIIAMGRDAVLVDLLKAGDPEATQRALGTIANPCKLDMFKTWTLGAEGSAGALLGGSLESGVAVDVSPLTRGASDPYKAPRSASWYATGTLDLKFGAGADVGLSYGCWTADNNRIAGPTRGYAADLLALYAYAVDLPAGLTVGLWFSPVNDQFQGITFSPTYGVGLALGSYASGETWKVADSEGAAVLVADTRFFDGTWDYVGWNGDVLSQTWLSRGPDALEVVEATQSGAARTRRFIRRDPRAFVDASKVNGQSAADPRWDIDQFVLGAPAYVLTHTNQAYASMSWNACSTVYFRKRKTGARSAYTLDEMDLPPCLERHLRSIGKIQ